MSDLFISCALELYGIVTKFMIQNTIANHQIVYEIHLNKSSMMFESITPANSIAYFSGDYLFKAKHLILIAKLKLLCLLVD